MILGGEMLSPEVRNKWGDAVTLMNACVVLFVNRKSELFTYTLQIRRYRGQYECDYNETSHTFYRSL